MNKFIKYKERWSQNMSLEYLIRKVIQKSNLHNISDYKILNNWFERTET